MRKRAAAHQVASLQPGSLVASAACTAWQLLAGTCTPPPQVPTSSTLTVNNLDDDPVSRGVILSAAELQALAAVALALENVGGDGTVVCMRVGGRR